MKVAEAAKADLLGVYNDETRLLDRVYEKLRDFLGQVADAKTKPSGE